MADGKRRRRAVAAGVPATLLLAFANPMPAMALREPDYPSWDDVEQARHNEATAQATVEQIEGILIRLEAEAAELNRIALELGEEYALAATALDAATAKLDRLKSQADAAQERADKSEQQVAVIVAQLARSGGGDVTLGLLLGSADDADTLLARLGTADRLTSSSAALLDRAIYDKKTAQALAKDARAAERERQKLADDAQEKFDVAQAAANDAQAKADAQRADIDRMYAQLATLKGTTEAVEREYQEGLAANPPSSPPPAPPPANPPPGVDPTPPPPVSSAVENAIAYATAQVGEPYQLGGMGPNAWDCSGLTKASYASVGVYIGTHSSTDQYNYMNAQGRLVPRDQMQRGDLLFYSDGGSASNPRKYHVAIYLGGGKMVEAPNPSAPVRIVNVRYGDLVPYVGRPTG
ncbi:C40 family peptidase [Pseudolysinimonas sp.]|uniref:C40 family peptidase n=1 Tax=Pseudolysinimonas sp. TaxID=2680009 RepID=UPI00286D672C|nr:C40 family peptidase [Pseudolysinimonas sp.]